MLQDNLRGIRQYYYKAPQFAKNIIGGSYRRLPESIVLGRSYRDFLKLINESNTWNLQRFQDYQFEQLRLTLTDAYHHIAFYRNKFDEYGVNPSNFRSLDDLKRFPTTTKAEIKSHLANLTSSDIPKWKWLPATTGGSTAEPMRFYQLKGVTRSKEKAFIGAGWSRVGYKHGMRVVQLKGRPVGQPQKKIFWEYEPIQNTLEMDSSYLTPDNLPVYYQAIKKFNPEFLIGFPSSIYFFARYLRQLNLQPPKVKGVMLASENVYPWQRQLVEETFNCRVFSHYGHTEMVLLGMEAEASHDLLFFPHYGYLEVLGADGQLKTKAGEKGELVGTSFHNPVMPFIRYRTQDIGTIGSPNAAHPGYPVLQDVEGRLQEFLITRDGRGISVCTMGAAHFDNLDNVMETQYYQDTEGKFVFRVVPGPGFNEQDRKRILAALQDKVGEDLIATVETVPSIERTRSGKHMMLVQKITHSEFNFEGAG